jgi:4-aminobutyrate--pyruvate transaminase
VELAADPASRTPFAAERGVGAYLVRRAQEHGLILRAMAGDIVAFSPPLIISDAEIDELLLRFERALDDTTAWIKSW